MARYQAAPSRKYIAIRGTVRFLFWTTALMAGYILAHLPSAINL